MARSWRMVMCVLLTSLSVCRSIFPQQNERMKKQQAVVSTRTRVTLGEGHVPSGPEETFGQGRAKREAAGCTVMETQGGRIVDAPADTTYSFFIQPLPGFSKLEFRAKLDNKLLPGSWKLSKKSLVVSSSQMEIDWTHPTWIPVKIEYLKKKIRFSPDPHTLRVKVGENVNEELLTSWWRTHSYEGFAVDAEGPVKFRLKCSKSSIVVAERHVDGRGTERTLLVACVLAGCFLLVVGATTLYLLIASRRRPQQNNQNDLPPVPTSLLRGCRVNQDGESENIYESIDEKTLAKFRQNLDSDLLAIGRTQHVKDHCGGVAEGTNENRKTSLDLTLLGGARGVMDLSLREEKEMTRECFGLDSPLESHYVDMHGIVSRTSSLNK